MFETLTTESKRSIALHSINEREAAGKPCNEVISNGLPRSTYWSQRVFVQAATDSQLDELLRGYNAVEDEDGARQRISQVVDELDSIRERQEAPLNAEEQRALDEDLEHARQVAEKAGSVESRLGRIEDLLGRIAVGIEKR